LSLLAHPPPTITAEDLGRIAQPVLLLWGAKDTFAKPEMGREIANALPHGELRLIERAGHLPWLEEPALCGQLASDFLGVVGMIIFDHF
jgi:pimeloyl-ACP methyl ester carboxylesterase